MNNNYCPGKTILSTSLSQMKTKTLTMYLFMYLFIYFALASLSFYTLVYIFFKTFLFLVLVFDLSCDLCRSCAWDGPQIGQQAAVHLHHEARPSAPPLVRSTQPPYTYVTIGKLGENGRHLFNFICLCAERCGLNSVCAHLYVVVGRC